MNIHERESRMGQVRALVKRYPMTAFFVLAFGLSWLAWTPYILGMNGLHLEPDINFPDLMGPHTSQLLGVLPGAYLGPIFSAFLVTWISDGRAGLRRWVGRLFRFKVNWIWYVLTIVGVPVVLCAVSIPFAGGTIMAPPAAAFGGMAAGLIMQLVTTGLAEEPGWRDFVLPRMQPRFGGLKTNLILGPLWGAWHLPLFWSQWGNYPNWEWWGPVEFIATTFMFSMVMTWVFNRTGQSLPLAMLLHCSVNNTFSTVWSGMYPGLTQQDSTHVFLISSTIVAVILLIATRGRLGWRPEMAQEHTVARAGIGELA